MKELARLLKRVDAEINNCEACHRDEIEKRRKYKVCLLLIPQLLGSFGDLTVTLLIGHRTCDLQVAGSTPFCTPGKLLTPVV